MLSTAKVSYEKVLVNSVLSCTFPFLPFTLFSVLKRCFQMSCSLFQRGNTLRLKYSCKFPPCTSGYYVDRTGNLNIKNKHFYKETKKDALNQWKHVCRVSDGINCTSFYVCEDHFLEKDFVNHTRRRLNY